MVKKYWTKFWFKSGYINELGLFRIFFYLSSLIFYSTIFQFSIQYADEIFFQPTSIYKLFSLDYLTTLQLNFIKQLCYLFIILSAFGFCTPVVCIVAAGFSFLYLGQWHNFGYYHHIESPFMVAFFIMAFAPSGAAYSIDSVLCRRFKWWPFKCKTSTNEEYYWPFCLMQVVWVFIFFSAFILKIYHGKYEWFTSNILQIILIRAEDYFNNYSHTPSQFISLRVRQFLIENSILCYFITFFTLMLEFSMPIALFFKGRIRFVLVFSGMIMFVGVYIIMGHQFIYSMLPMALAWMPWTQLIVKLDICFLKLKRLFALE